jgi:NAD(P)-dependent dehydrogenase (short-subunit alcohol dehydrogenase family)
MDARPTPGAASTRGVAVVTGAARRLGRSIALALARDGWDVGVHYGSSRDDALQTVLDIEALGRRATAVEARLEDEQAVLAVLPAVADALGPVRCLVNSASLFRFDDAASFDFDSFRAHLLPNLAAPVLLARELHRLLPAEVAAVGNAAGADKPGGADAAVGAGDPGGVVINLLDQKLYGLNPDFLSYTLAKAGLAAATTMLAQALAPRVRVVGVAPGLTLPSYLQDDAAFQRAHRDHAPLGRASTPEDIAASVVFAASNRSMTGAVILCDGGQHLHPLPRDISMLEQRPR